MMLRKAPEQRGTWEMHVRLWAYAATVHSQAEKCSKDEVSKFWGAPDWAVKNGVCIPVLGMSCAPVGSTSKVSCMPHVPHATRCDHFGLPTNAPSAELPGCVCERADAGGTVGRGGEGLYTWKLSESVSPETVQKCRFQLLGLLFSLVSPWQVARFLPLAVRAALVREYRAAHARVQQDLQDMRVEVGQRSVK